MERRHLSWCAVALVLALGFVALSGASAGSLGLLVAALACPLAMVLAMKLLMGDQRASDRRPSPAGEAPPAPADAERG